MKNFLLAVAVCALGMPAMSAQNREPNTPEEWREYNKMIADKANFSKDFLRFSGTDMDGRPVTSEELKGANVLYVFGGSHCSPCIAIGRILRDIAAEKRYDLADIKFVILTSDDVVGRNLLVEKFGLDRKMIVHLPSEKEQEVGLIGPMRPVTVLVDRDGKVLFKKAGGPDPRDMKLARQQFDKMFVPAIENLVN